MSQILIKLGCEDMHLCKTNSNIVYKGEHLEKINALLLKIEDTGKQLGRYGFNLERLFSQYDNQTGSLPTFVARIRSGNEDENQIPF